MLTVERLKEYGANVEEGISRCAGNAGLYLRLVGIALRELESTTLGDELKNGELDRAFASAHKLKGGVANLALTPILTPLSALTELLRGKTPGDYAGLFAEMTEQTKKLLALTGED